MNKRVEIRVALETKGIVLPYPTGKRSDRETFPYRSPLKEPEAIEDIPELFGETGMKQFIRQLNDSSGAFETVRVVHWYTQPENGNAFRVLSFGFVFRDIEKFKDLNQCLFFAGKLLDQASKNAFSFDSPPLLEIQGAWFTEEGRTGYIMDLCVAGLGEDQTQAKLRLDQILESMLPLFRVAP
jgi:hypothetical protein